VKPPTVKTEEENKPVMNELSPEKKADQLLGWFSAKVDNLTGWGKPTYERSPKDEAEALELMEQELYHLGEAWSDMRRQLHSAIYQKRKELGL